MQVVPVGADLGSTSRGSPRFSLSLLPAFAVRVDEGIAIDASTHDWPAGTLLVAIDESQVEQLIDALLPLVAADGRDRAAAEAVLLDDLPRFHALAHGQSADYTLTVQLPDGTTEQVRLSGASRDTIRTLRDDRRTHVITGYAPPDPTWTALDAHTGMLRLPSFGVADMDAVRAELTALLDDQLGEID